MTEIINKKVNHVSSDKKKFNKHSLLFLLIEIFIVYVLSGLSIAKEIYPFGIAMLFNVGIEKIPAAALASILGFWNLAKTDYMLKYFASIFLSAAIRLIFEKNNNFSNLIKSLLSAIASLLPSFLIIVMYDRSLYYGMTSVIEGILTGIVCFFFSLAKETFVKTAICSGRKNNISAVFFICILAISLIDIEIFKINLGMIFSIMTICTFSQKGEGASCLIGSALATAFIIIKCENSIIPLLFIMVGLLSGIFNKIGKTAVVASSIITTFMMIFSVEKTNIPLLTGSFLGSALYLFIPSQATENLIGGIQRKQEDNQVRYICMIVKSRLLMLSEALCEIKKTVNTVSAVKSKYNVERYDVVYNTVCEKICKYCPNYQICWQKNYTVTTDIIGRAINKLRKNKEILYCDYPQYFKDICNSYSEISEAVEEGFNLYLINKKNQREIQQVRMVITEQLQGISDLIKNVSENVDNIYRSDIYLQNRVFEYFKKKNIQILKCFCFYDKNNIMTLEIETGKNISEIPNHEDTILDLSEICERNFDYPKTIKKENTIDFIYTEIAVYKVETAFISKNGNREKISGDSIKQFQSNSYAYTIISDGMSTGKEASIQSMMTIDMLWDLLVRGADPQSSVKIINSALLCKSSSECMATMDITEINLYTGGTSFYKSATPPTYVLKDKRAMAISSGSLPLGILKNIEPQKFSLKLNEGDIIVNLTDGATESGENWILSQLEYLSDKSADEIAENLYLTAMERKSGIYTDDVTIAVTKIHKVADI